MNQINAKITYNGTVEDADWGDPFQDARERAERFTGYLPEAQIELSWRGRPFPKPDETHLELCNRAEVIREFLESINVVSLFTDTGYEKHTGCKFVYEGDHLSIGSLEQTSEFDIGKVAYIASPELQAAMAFEMVKAGALTHEA